MYNEFSMELREHTTTTHYTVLSLDVLGLGQQISQLLFNITHKSCIIARFVTGATALWPSWYKDRQGYGEGA
jgi:hypothetical protein